MYLNTCLDEVIAGVTYPWSDDPNYLEQSFMIWVDDIALRLRGIDFCYFVDLIEQAVARIQVTEGDEPLKIDIQVVKDRNTLEARLKQLMKPHPFQLN